jgi:two-component system chemotaxis sensor kinase CheA
MLHGTAGMAGATITGDGRIALILDIPSLLDRYA